MAQTHRVREGATLDDAAITADRSGVSNDTKADATVCFAERFARARGQASKADVEAMRRAGFPVAAIVAIVADGASNVFTNIINEALKTGIDFPRIAARQGS